MHVLSPHAHLEIITIDGGLNTSQGREGWTYDDIDPVINAGVQAIAKLFHEVDGLEVCLVHLPVGRYHGLSHLTSRASRPGSLRPSRNSKEAPPPVEMCVTRSCRPNFER